MPQYLEAPAPQSADDAFDLVVSDETIEASAIIGNGLNIYNDAITGYADRCGLSVVVRDAQTGATLGGAVGRTSLGLLFLDLFHLPAHLRGQGMGSRILAAFEAEGRRRGCKSAVLYTISFQAPDFYQRHGWRVFGEVPCDPPCTCRVFMTKSLVDGATAVSNTHLAQQAVLGE